MNKKISTLMASALLAGALVTPADLLAAIQYKVEKSYANATAVSAPGPSSDASGYMVLNISGKDYVVTVNGNAMVATPFEDALLSTSIMTIAQDGSSKYTFTVNSSKVGFGSGVFGATTTEFPVANCNLAGSAFKIGTASNSVKLEGTTFSVDGDGTSTFAAKFVQEADLEIDYAGTPKTDAELDEVDFGKYYILMNADGQALKAVTAGTDGYAITETGAFDPADAAFYWTVEKQGSTSKAAFRSKAGLGLLVESGVNVLYAALDNDDKGLTSTSGAVSLTQKTGGAASTVLPTILLADATPKSISVKDLQRIYGASFSATIKYADKALENNPFTGNLTPVKWADLTAGYQLEPATSGDDFMLQNGDGKIIVVQTTDKYAAAGPGNYAYQVVALAPKDLATAMLGNAAAKAKYVTQFSIYALPLFNAGVDEAVSFITVKGASGMGISSIYQLGSISLKDDDVYTLAAEVVDADKYLNDLSIKLSKNTLINLKEVLKTPSFFTIKNVNTKKDYAAGTGANFGKVLGLNEDGEVSYMKKDEVLVGYPETQWAITVNADGEMVIKNRENPTAVPDNAASTTYMTLNPNNLYVVSGKANTYALIDGTSLTAVDTIEIAPVATTEADGYKRFNANALKDQLFNIGYYSAVKGVSYVTESHKNNHQVGLVNEKANSTEWRLGALMYEENDAWNNPVAYIPDTIRVESALGYWDADAKAFKDTKSDDVDANNAYLKVLAYSLKNSSNDEYLKYDETDGRNRYATGLDGEKEGFKKLTDAQYFAVKMAGNDKYNLIPVTYTDAAVADGYADGNDGAPYEVKTVLATEKVYSGDSADKGILNKRGMYSKRENDLFTIEEKEAPAYLKLTQGEIIKLYRAEYTSESNVLYEKGEFLGIGNAVETPAINPALYVDTVYVNREANNRWEYLLGVNITRIDTTYKCDEPSHSHLIHRADTTKGRFLVNFADSAIVAAGKEDIHTNKYMYSDSKGDWAKLGFVPGFRTADVLSIWNGEKGKADLIEVGTPAPQLVKFAFRIVDNDAKTFVIETGYKALNEDATIDGRGYLRYDNGVVYVTDNIEDAEVFKANLDETRIPTANEGINASEVSVIASEGKVIINGAQGKAVVISNILGQTIANTVISSDNATIAAPQGVVVVAVEGEAAVKAIVK